MCIGRSCSRLHPRTRYWVKPTIYTIKRTNRYSTIQTGREMRKISTYRSENRGRDESQCAVGVGVRSRCFSEPLAVKTGIFLAETADTEPAYGPGCTEPGFSVRETGSRAAPLVPTAQGRTARRRTTFHIITAGLCACVGRLGTRMCAWVSVYVLYISARLFKYLSKSVG